MKLLRIFDALPKCCFQICCFCCFFFFLLGLDERFCRLMLNKVFPNFSCFYLHKIRYLEALLLQKSLVQWHSQEKSKATLLLLEHHPVYTVGLRSFVYDHVEEKFLKSLGADFVRTNRGGLITFHGPGQLVVYPVVNLKSLGLGVRKYVSQLEEVVIQLCSSYHLTATRSPHTGVWVGDNKICAMGINVTRSVTSHGLALNCDVNLRWFNYIVPCGIHGKGITSLTECLNRTITVDDILPRFVENFSRVFNVNCSPIQDVDKAVSVQSKFEFISEFTNVR